MKWLTEKRLYEIHETNKKNDEIYTMYATGSEIRDYCKKKNELNAYVDGLGGDKGYSCWAVEILR